MAGSGAAGVAHAIHGFPRDWTRGEAGLAVIRF